MAQIKGTFRISRNKITKGSVRPLASIRINASKNNLGQNKLVIETTDVFAPRKMLWTELTNIKNFQNVLKHVLLIFKLILYSRVRDKSWEFGGSNILAQSLGPNLVN